MPPAREFGQSDICRERGRRARHAFAAPSFPYTRSTTMLTIGIALLVCWVLAFMLLRKVLGAVIHLVLIVAIVAIGWHFIGPMVR